jgi:threonylcarbamoyladenosine tRNA methylthiotransferase MtaB
MKFYITTLGCKVNAYESEGIKELLLKENDIETDNPAEADIIIVNTCSVTNSADNKCLKMVRHLKRENDRAIFIVCGCSVQNNIDKYKNLNINYLLGNNEKNKIPYLIKNESCYENIYDIKNIEYEKMTINNFEHIRAYIKIQDGCDNYCTYCIIPYLRGHRRCKDYQTIINEANTLVKNGYQEIVLLGIDTGTFKSDNHDLADLINDLSKIKGLNRIRLSSIEITELDENFYNVLKNNKVLCDHLHIPLQAGSDEILKKMNRKYDLKTYTEKINRIRTIRPDIYIATDCLVGFPGETEEMFENTLKFCESIGFSKIHVFPYSKRNGTPASRMPNQVSQKDKHARARKLIKLSKKLEKEYYNKFIGQTLPCLIEEIKDGKSIGHTSNMLRLVIPKILNVNEIYNIEIKKEYYE